jgi:hypothetical protein
MANNNKRRRRKFAPERTRRKQEVWVFLKGGEALGRGGMRKRKTFYDDLALKAP